ncbi:MAG: DNA-binding response regulator [Mycobacterium sp.]|nr:DNA-binding response regulator [Mycobacterium sp.]MCW2550342.1 DNA-binding response regulator [Mycobacterium sp.]
MRTRPAILVVDTDPNVVSPLAVTLMSCGFAVHTANDGPAALARARELRPAAVILEVTLPSMDGFEVLRQLRTLGVDAPGLFVSNRTALHDKLTGLNAGGDDYITKPFSPEEVLARLRAILRRTRKANESIRGASLIFADITLDEDSYDVLKAGNRVTLSPVEFKLLRYLMINSGAVLSRSMILDHLWRNDFRGETTVVESYIYNLRRKMDSSGKRLIHTVRGVGYVLREAH